MAVSNGILDGAAATAISDAGYPPGNTIDGNAATYWHSNGQSMPHWIRFDLGAGNAKAGGEYTLRTRPSNDQHYFRNFTFEGSNDGTNWTVLDTQTDQVFVNGVERTFPCSNTTNYRYYRFNITSTSSDYYSCMAEISVADNTVFDAEPACYLRSRRNRMNTKGISTKNSLA